jgi:hypothetical protein
MPIPGVTVEYLKPGTLPQSWRAGDYLLVSAGVWKDEKRSSVPYFSRLIQIGQAMRFRGDRKDYAHWNHAVWVSDGELIEVSGGRIRTSPYDRYRNVEFHVVHSNLTAEQRREADAFVRYALSQDRRFGVATIVSVTFSLLTGLNFSFGVPGTLICSGLVAAALGAPQWREDPSHVMPAHLAEYADLRPWSSREGSSPTSVATPAPNAG